MKKKKKEKNIELLYATPFDVMHASAFKMFADDTNKLNLGNFFKLKELALE